MISLLAFKKFLIAFVLIGGAIAVPLTIDNLKNNAYYYKNYIDKSTKAESEPQYDDELIKKCGDNAEIIVSNTNGTTETINSADRFMKLLIEKEDEKIPMLKDIKLPEGC